MASASHFKHIEPSKTSRQSYLLHPYHHQGF